MIRNDYTDLPATPPADAGRSPTWQVMLKLHQQRQLTKLQSSCFEIPRPQFELYDLESDPNESNNLAEEPKYSAVRAKLSSELQKWTRETNDFMPSMRTPDEFDRVTGEPDHAVRVRPRRSKKEMFGTLGSY